MEKVSRIIPSNARIETVDMAGVKPGRNKLPGVDRENVKPTARLEGAELSAVDRLTKNDNFRIPKPDETRHAEIAKRINQDFFATYNKKADLVNKNETEVVPKNPSAAESLKMNNLKETMAKNVSETEEVEDIEPRAKIIDLTPEKEASIIDNAKVKEEQLLSKYA